MKFLVDVCAGNLIAKWLADKGHDTLRVSGRDPRMADSEVIGWALREGRIIITIDKDFQQLAYLMGAPHSGIVRLPNVRSAKKLELIGIVLERHSEELANGAIVNVTQSNIRVTKTG